MTSQNGNAQVDQKHPFHNHKPVLALVLSILFAGLGQLYNRRWVKGFVLIILQTSYLIVFYDFINIGLWGIVTLGEIPRVDHSVLLMLQGIIAIIILLMGLTVYGINIRDAYLDAQKLKAGQPVPTLREGFRTVYEKGFPYFLVLPGLLMLIFVVIVPLIFMVLLAFTDYNLYNSPPRNLLNWVGLQNFIDLLTVPIWQSTLINVLSWTIVWTFVATTLQIALGMFLAILVNDERVKFKRLIRTVFILPWAVPAFVTIIIFSAMFNDQFGAINRDILGPLLGVQIPWLSDPFWTRFALIMIQTWLGFPFIFALFTGVLQSVSKDWYEAAEVDGASRWQKFKYITFPHLMYATAPLLIMQYAGNFNNFNIIYLFNQGGPAIRGQNAGGTDILISWVYKLTFDSNNYNMAAAISIIMGLFVAGFAFYQFRRTRAFKEEGKIY
ncbi:maltose ABC transporter permease [Caldalkalibacillus thermarum]|uniref:sugar ABC transporter permease n=1 Tax=Caldalkalibacillus thermarum TaxID=296745 RepID=UPI0019AFC622|nr:sugar ABC transporter permease [Caldalkalibacillus thermarum]GGK11806.1 maltose ABC transporter permease [Caldalkalibacillus thermarum]